VQFQPKVLSFRKS